jgi:hypothetical protein
MPVCLMLHHEATKTHASLEIALVLVCFDHVASFVVNANHSAM